MDGKRINPDQPQKGRRDLRLARHCYTIRDMVQRHGDIPQRPDGPVRKIGVQKIPCERVGILVADRGRCADSERRSVQRIRQAGARTHGLMKVDGGTGQTGDREQQKREQHGGVAATVREQTSQTMSVIPCHGPRLPRL